MLHAEKQSLVHMVEKNQSVMYIAFMSWKRIKALYAAVMLLDLFNTELFLAATKIPGGRQEGRGRLSNDTLSPPERSCIRLFSSLSHFTLLLVDGSKIMRQRPQTTIFEEKGELKLNQMEIMLKSVIISS